MTLLDCEHRFIKTKKLENVIVRTTNGQGHEHSRAYRVTGTCRVCREFKFFGFERAPKVKK